MFGEKFDNSLCDLGSSVNVVPLKIARELKWTFTAPLCTLKYADASSSRPKGFVSDMLVHIGHCLVPVDFTS